MDKLPSATIQHVYEYDTSYEIQFGKVLFQMKMHCFIYRCSERFKPCSQCFCYCQTCGAFLGFCKQIYFKDGDMTEDITMGIVGLGF